MQARTFSLERPIICSLAVRAVSARWTAQAASSVAAMTAEAIRDPPICRPPNFAEDAIMHNQRVKLRQTKVPESPVDCR
jgi:hypothetical protein